MVTAVSWHCICCALPHKLLTHLADQSEGEHRQMLLDQAEHTKQLRTSRATHAAGSASAKKGAQPLHRQVYSAQGQTMLPGQLLRDEGHAPAKDAAANHVYDSLGVALQFFKTVLNRDSVDGRGMRIDASVHYGYRFANAMWTGEQMVVGDGDGRCIVDLPKSLGLIAHEFCHGVSQHLVPGGLGVVVKPEQPPMLEGEAGALNESFSDVFASMIKQWQANQTADRADWLLGEDVLAPSSGKAVRSLKDPGNRHLTWKEDDQIKDYRHYTPGDEAHKASGIASHAFYLAATALGGRSWETLAAVWLKGYDKLHKHASFNDAARATCDVAAVLHGERSKVHQALRAAWSDVHVLA